MSVITKEIVLMSFLHNALYEIKNDKDFIKHLKDELREEELKNMLNSVDEQTKKLFVEPLSVKEIRQHLKKGNEIFEKAIENQSKSLMKELEGFQNADFLKEYFSSEDKILELKIDNSCVFIEEYYDSVFRRIVFENAEICFNGCVITENKIDVSYDSLQLIRTDGKYIFEIINHFTDECYRIKFDNIYASLKAYRADSDPLFWLFIKTPWEYITALAEGINAHLNLGLANTKEKKITGLIKHLVGECFTDIQSLPAILYDLIEKHNLKNIIRPPYDLSQPNLCKKKFEPFWREIFELISESQKELPSYFEENISDEALNNHKRLIDEELNKHGYIGTYPDYCKKSCVKKPTIFTTYNLSHVVAFENHTEHHIHCHSFKGSNAIETAFFVGTIFNKNSGSQNDIYSTMFDCNGRAVFSILSTIHLSTKNFGAMKAETYENVTKKAIKAAIKKAELRKSEKEDHYFRSVFDLNPTLNLKALFAMFLFFSLGFSLITPALMIILEGSSLAEVIEFLKSEPLLMIFGPVGGLIATFLIALFEWISSKK